MDRTFKVCTDCTALPHLSFSIPSVTLRTPFPTSSPSPHHPFIILLFYYFIYLNTKFILFESEMEDNKSNHPPPKTRRAQVANACMKCRDAKLKVSIRSFFFFFLINININTTCTQCKQYKTKGKRKKTGNKCCSYRKNFHLLYSAPPLVPFAIDVSIGSSRACTT